MSASMFLKRDEDRIDEEASGWVVLAEEGPLSSEEQRALDEWLEADPRHERTWRELTGVWSQVPQLTALSALASVEDDPGHRASPTARLGRLRASMTGMMAAAAAVLALVLIPYLCLQQPTRYATGVAEVRFLALGDGTQVTLGPRSKLSVHFDDHVRRVTLDSGEAFFEVVRDGRPFLVQAGPSLIRVLGTKFDVNHGDGSVQVGVLEGVVRVSRTASSRSAPAEMTLRAGERAEVALGPSAAGKPIATGASQPPGSWREGRLIYENARLADVVADMNRYYGPGVVIAEPAIGELRVIASFKTAEIPAFLSAVSDVVPVQALKASDGSFRLEPARN